MTHAKKRIKDPHGDHKIARFQLEFEVVSALFLKVRNNNC